MNTNLEFGGKRSVVLNFGCYHTSLYQSQI
jgi:hypothetical protein